MTPLSVRTRRYAQGWVGSSPDFIEDEVTLDRAGTPVPATLVRPRGAREPLPAWIVLHGITRPGRAHAQLVRFTRALAHAGIATMVPEVPEWRELDLAPGLTAPSVAAALKGLRDSGVARDAPVGVVGFSFGAPHAIAAAAHPDLREEIGALCGFGGYASVEHAFRFMMTGVHEISGRTHRLRPDPYGRWIVAANYLTAAKGHEEATDVADAMRDLARHAGDVGVASWDPVYDPYISELRATVHEERRSIFDLLAPRSGVEPDRQAALVLADVLTTAACRAEPDIDPIPRLAQVSGRVHLIHGFRDHLIPCSESHRLATALVSAEPRLTVTRLFGHSSEDRVHPWRRIVELPRFARALGAVLNEL